MKKIVAIALLMFTLLLSGCWPFLIDTWYPTTLKGSAAGNYRVVYGLSSDNYHNDGFQGDVKISGSGDTEYVNTIFFPRGDNDYSIEIINIQLGGTVNDVELSANANTYVIFRGKEAEIVSLEGKVLGGENIPSTRWSVPSYELFLELSFTLQMADEKGFGKKLTYEMSGTGHASKEN